MSTFSHFWLTLWYQREALQWRDRVIVNGGTVSNTTLQAVSQFVRDCKAGGVWDRISRVNLFAGDQLAAAVVPLKIGGGFATDVPNANVNPGDYSELGVDGGIKFRRTPSSFLDTGWNPLLLAALFDVHMSYYLNGCVLNNNEMGVVLGAWEGGDIRFTSDYNPTGGGTVRYYLGSGDQYGASPGNLGAAGTSRGCSVFTVRGGAPPPVGDFKIWNNGAPYGSFNPVYTSTTLPNFTVYIGGANYGGISGFQPNEVPYGGYTIGTSLNDDQGVALSNAIIAFNKTMGRYLHPAVGDWQRRVRQAFNSNASWDNNILSILGDFAETVEAIGVKPKLLRANLFCGANTLQSRVPIFNAQAYYNQGSIITADLQVGHLDAQWSSGSGWAKTNPGNAIVSAQVMNTDVGGIAVWVKEVPTFGTLFGAADSLTPTNEVSIKINGAAIDGTFGGLTVTKAASPSSGFYHVVRASNTDLRIFQNGQEVDSDNLLTVPGGALTPCAEGLYIVGAVFDDVNNTVRTCGYSQESAALTPAEASLYYDAWLTAQIALGRFESFGLLTEGGDNLMASNGKQLATEQS